MRDEVWFKHDARSRTDPKMSFFIKCEGMAGYGVFWALIEVLHYQNDHEFDLNIELAGIADQLKMEEAQLQKIIDRLIQCGLFKREGDKVFQARLKQDQAERSKKNSATSASKCLAGRIGGIISAAKKKGATKEEIQELRSRLQAEAQADQAGALEEKEEKRDIDSTSDEAQTKHPSPKAPKHLVRKQTELQPFPNDDGPVWITCELYDAIGKQWGEAERDFLIQNLADWSTENETKFKKRKDHGKTIRNFRRMEHSKGKVFFDHEQLGPNYYPEFQVKKWKQEQN